MASPDPKNFISADSVKIIGNTYSPINYSDISTATISGNKVIEFDDTWTNNTEALSGGSNFINKVTIKDLLDVANGVRWDNKKSILSFQDNSIAEYDGTGCMIPGSDQISLKELAGSVDLINQFNKTSVFGKVFDFQFRQINFGEYKFANSKICSALATALGFLSVDKIANDEKIRMDRQNNLYEKYKDDEKLSPSYPAYSGFLVSDDYINNGWINFDYLIESLYKDPNAYEADASLSLKFKKFGEAKRVLVIFLLNYLSNITELNSNNKITDFGVRIIEDSTKEELDLVSFKNETNEFIGSTSLATFSGELSPEEIEHKLVPQFRINPEQANRKNKPDILNTIDPIHWTTGTQDFTEQDFPGITSLRKEFGDEAFYSTRLNQTRGFAQGGGNFNSGFVTGGFFNQAEIDPQTNNNYGMRSSTELWDGNIWSVSSATNPSPRGLGLGGGSDDFKVICFGTVANFSNVPKPISFSTNVNSSRTMVLYQTAWETMPQAANTNSPRHSVAGIVTSVYKATDTNGNDINAGQSVDTNISSLIGEKVQNDVNISVCNSVLTNLTSFVRDAGQRASGSNSLTSVSSAFDPQSSVFGNTNPTINQVPTTFNGSTTPTAPQQGTWSNPVVLNDGTVIANNTSGQVNPNLIHQSSSGSVNNVDNGNYYEIWNIGGIAFNGSYADPSLNYVHSGDLSNVFENISYVRMFQHTSIPDTNNPGSYQNAVYPFEKGCWLADPTRIYPVKTVGTSYVGGNTAGLATGGKTSNIIYSCEATGVIKNLIAGYNLDSTYSEFNNSVLNLVYENSGNTWIRRDNLPESVCYHVGVGDADHALYWGGIHASLEIPDVVVGFPGCDDWYKLINSFGGVFHRKGNKGLDKEVRYTFFASQAYDAWKNTYYKSGDYRYDNNRFGITFSADYLASSNSASMSANLWSDNDIASIGHIYSVTYGNKLQDQDEPQTKLNSVRFTKGQSWIGDTAKVANLNIIPSIGYDEREAAAVNGQLGESETTEQVGSWVRSLMQNGWDSYKDTYRPDTSTQTFPSGLYPNEYNYNLQGIDHKPVWKYSGHPVQGGMWIWSRPTAGESLFNPKHISSAQWDTLSKWTNHSFNKHIGLEGFWNKYTEIYSDLNDTSYKPFSYWVETVIAGNGDTTYNTLYDYDPFKIKPFFDKYGSSINYNNWQDFIAQNAGRLRIRSEDISYRKEYLRTYQTSQIDSSLYYLTKSGSVTISASSGNYDVFVPYVYEIPSCFNVGISYQDKVILNFTGANIAGNVTLKSVSYNGFTIHIDQAPYLAQMNWAFSIDVSKDIQRQYCLAGKNYLDLANAICYQEDQVNNVFTFFTQDRIIKVIQSLYLSGQIPKEALTDPFIAHIPEEGLTPPIRDYAGNWNIYAPNPNDISVYQDVFLNVDKIPALSGSNLDNSWDIPRYKIESVMYYDNNGIPQIASKKVFTYSTVNSTQVNYNENIASYIDPITHYRLFSPKTRAKFLSDFNVSDVIPVEMGRFIPKYFPDSVLTNNTSAGLVIYGIGNIDTHRQNVIDAANPFCGSQLYKTNKELMEDYLYYGNTNVISGGMFDLFWFNNVTRLSNQVNVNYPNPQIDLNGVTLYVPAKNSTYFSDYHYGFQLGSGTAPVTTMVDGFPSPTITSCISSATLTPAISSGVGYYKSIDLINLPGTTYSPSASFAYHFGYVRDTISPNPWKNLSESRFDPYTYFKYRFDDVEDTEWLYIPNTQVGEYNGGHILDEFNFATGTYAPTGITYSFYITKDCSGLEQLIYGRQKNKFVERWHYPFTNEVINAVKLNSYAEGISGVTVESISVGVVTNIPFENYDIFKNGTLSVAEFTNVIKSEDLIKIMKVITRNQSSGFIDTLPISGYSGSTWSISGYNEVKSYLDAGIVSYVSESNSTHYLPLTYDYYSGNPALSATPFFNPNPSYTQIRFISGGNTSSIRDRAALWPWCDLLEGDARNIAIPGKVTWQFTTDGRFWLAETVSRELITKADCVNDPLNRPIVRVGSDFVDEGYDKYPSQWYRETYRIRIYSPDSLLEADINLTYDEASGPIIKGQRKIGTDYSLFGNNLAPRTIELQHFESKPINGPSQTWVSDTDENKSWLAHQWMREEISSLRNTKADLLPSVQSISGTDLELYNYRHVSLCEMITGGYQTTSYIPSQGYLCSSTGESNVWIYSIPLEDQTSELIGDAFFIEESPYVRTAIISGTMSGSDYFGNVTENIRDIQGSNKAYGSQIVRTKKYINGSIRGLKVSKAIIAGPDSYGIGMLGYGKSKAYNGQLLHLGNRTPVTYSGVISGAYIPSEDMINQAWPWNIIGKKGLLGPKTYTDMIDSNGDYWFAFGEKDNNKEIEDNNGDIDVNYKNSYVIGLVKAANIGNLMKTALAGSNYIQAKEVIDNFDNYYSLSLNGSVGSRFRDAILELVNGVGGDKIFDLYIRLLEENVIDVDNTNYYKKYDGYYTWSMPKDSNDNLLGSKALPLAVLNNPEVTPVQVLSIVDDMDPNCIACYTCNATTQFDIINPTNWIQHNHDQWTSPFLESPFSGPFSIDGFNIWLTAGKTNRWGTPLWATIKNGKIWVSYRRSRLHANPYRNHLVLSYITASIAIEDFAESATKNIPVYVTYDEFLYNYNDYSGLQIVKDIVSNENLGGSGRDCVENFAAYAPNTDLVSSVTTIQISGFQPVDPTLWQGNLSTDTCFGNLIGYNVQTIPMSSFPPSAYVLVNDFTDCSNIRTYSVSVSAFEAGTVTPSGMGKQSFYIPNKVNNITLTIAAGGGAAGGGYFNRTSDNADSGSDSVCVTVEIPVYAGELLTLYLGSGGKTSDYANAGHVGGDGGENGGLGKGGRGGNGGNLRQGSAGGGGGGASSYLVSDIRGILFGIGGGAGGGGGSDNNNGSGGGGGGGGGIAIVNTLASIAGVTWRTGDGNDGLSWNEGSLGGSGGVVYDTNYNTSDVNNEHIGGNGSTGANQQYPRDIYAVGGTILTTPGKIYNPNEYRYTIRDDLSYGKGGKNSEAGFVNGRNGKDGYALIEYTKYDYYYITTLTTQVTGYNQDFICKDAPVPYNEARYTEWVTSFIQEYKKRKANKPIGDQQKYYSKYDIMNTYDSNTIRESETITEKPLVEYDWRKYQDGVGLGGDAPLLNVTGPENFKCNILNEYYIGQVAFGNTEQAIIAGGYAVPVDGQLNSSNSWWERTTSSANFKWNTQVINPEDSLNSNYKNRSFSPFFSNGQPTATPTTLGGVVFDLTKKVSAERQGIAKFQNQTTLTVSFESFADWITDKTAYSITLTPDRNIHAWWSDKTETGFTINVELDNYVGNIDWQVSLVTDVPASQVESLGPQDTFDVLDNI